MAGRTPDRRRDGPLHLPRIEAIKRFPWPPRDLSLDLKKIVDRLRPAFSSHVCWCERAAPGEFCVADGTVTKETSRPSVQSANKKLRYDRWKRLRVHCIETRRVTKPSGADPRTPRRIGRDVKDDVIWPRRVAGDPAYARQVIQLQLMANAPGDVMVRARRVSTDPHCPNDLLSRSI
jgi:hypothetical protein